MVTQLFLVDAKALGKQMIGYRRKLLTKITPKSEGMLKFDSLLMSF